MSPHIGCRSPCCFEAFQQLCSSHVKKRERECKCIQVNCIHSKLQQNTMVWHRQLGIIRSRPFQKGCQASAVFTAVLFLSLFKCPPLSVISTSKVPLSGSVRSWGRLSAPRRDEDDIQRLTGKIKPHQAFAAHRGGCLSWRLRRGPRGLTWWPLWGTAGAAPG